MKGFIAGIAGVALAAFLASAPTVLADENGEVHHWSSDTSTPRPMVHVAGTEMKTAKGSREHSVNDDPDYDLSGSGDHLFLVDDGSAFQGNNMRRSAGSPVFAQYRQDWLAVAAGDRPVRAFNPSRSTMERSSVTYTKDRLPLKVYRTTSTARYTAAHRAHRRTYRASNATSVRRHRATPIRYSYTTRTRTTSTPVHQRSTSVVAATPEVRYDQMGRETFQIHDSWYMKSDGGWLRASSWRGPFVRIDKSLVPREVRMSAKHPGRNDMD